MYLFLVRILFILPPEAAHAFAMNFLQLTIKVPGVKRMIKNHFYIHKPVRLLGLEFPNRVGIAAGFDKNAKYLEVLETLGFGFAEIGTVTPKPQPGNDKPRSFRLVRDKALINRMGFNNDGVETVRERLLNRKTSILIGGNIGKNKVTPNEDAVNDYAICFERLYEVCDYFVINVSSPNTPGLRALQDKDALVKIISKLMQMREGFTRKGAGQKPLLLKIAPDLTHEQLDEIIEVTHSTKLDGLIATNTTISREKFKNRKI
jgi:dihydroorotate dehydrogenase